MESTVMANTDDLVADYLRQLNQAGADLPAAEREELLDQIRGHLDEARTDERAGDPLYIRQVLDNLGTPDEVAAAAREQGTAAGTQQTGITRETVAVVLLTVGWVLIGLGWVIGAILAWSSNRWNTREKIAATFLVSPVLLGFLIAHRAPTAVGIPLVLVGFAASCYWAVWLLERARTRRLTSGVASAPRPN
jgi:uncharacterized membrane protein